MEYLEKINAGSAWVGACKVVMENGHEVYDNNILLKEVLDMFVVVEDATCRCPILDNYADSKMIDWMVEQNFNGNKPVLNWGYCYGMRFRDYGGVNQIDKIVNKLKNTPEAKSATISLMDPSVDFDGHMPCIVALDFKIRNNKLYLTGFFRSQDIGKKFYADILALGEIQREVAEKLNIAKGYVKIFISSAHIYETEFEKVNEFISLN